MNKLIKKPEIRVEHDESFQVSAERNTDELVSYKEIPSNRADEIEKLVTISEKMNGILLKTHALKLLVTCLATIFGVYVIDLAVINIGLINSNMGTTLVDFLKYIATALLGYLFAIKQIDS